MLISTNSPKFSIARNSTPLFFRFKCIVKIKGLKTKTLNFYQKSSCLKGLTNVILFCRENEMPKTL